MIRMILILALCVIIEKSHGEVPQLVVYLKKYGYLETPEQGGPPDSFGADNDAIIAALKRAQKFAGIPVTGKLDSRTIKMLAAPRCGVPDVEPRIKRYSTYLGWTKTKLTYGILNYSPKLSRNHIETAIRQAFSTWSRPTRLQFSPGPIQTADINIGFFIRQHGDRYPFDGPLGELGHAFYPSTSMAGDVHLDGEENWTAGSSQNIKNNQTSFSFLAVFTHELGHALGLKHSANPDSIMRPIYTTKTTLGMDDIRGIQSLYGRP